MQKLSYTFALLLAASLIFTSCRNNDNTTDPGVVINGIRWATRNLDYPGTFAPYPHSTGRLYQWGTLNGETHHWAATGAITGWNSNSFDRVAWTTANDPCPPGWRVPTRAEFDALLNAGYEWTTRSGVNGTVFGSGNNTLFLPAAGFRFADGTLTLFDIGTLTLSDVGTDGYYWSSSPNTHATHAMNLFIWQGINSVNRNPRAHGFSVRCVAE